MDLVKLYNRQVSLPEWLEKMNHPLASKIRTEDNDKRPRMGILNKIIGLPYDKPVRMSAREIANNTFEFQKFLEEHGSELCALRLVPKEEGLPKFRNRGFTVANSVPWFFEQKIDPNKYIAEIVPHSESPIWSTIFVVNAHGIFGEIIKGGHNLLTQGFYDEVKPITFSYDWNDWKLSEENAEAVTELVNIAKYLFVKDLGKQQELTKELNVNLFNNYLGGYFETVSHDDTGLWFIDYNRILGDLYSNYICEAHKVSVQSDNKILIGQSGSGGSAIGKVVIISPNQITGTVIQAGDVLVCNMTSPDYLPLMQKAVAVITDLGGILSHAAIVCRELKKPAVVGTKNATQVLKDGDLVEVDGDNGTVRII
ncbi:MAG: hypothetical protein A2538_05050 [Candidatus Magasanikbacteria bacterium RIFOXYD2_FULL_41_14]|uniref:PEP-utilising enzyme mobile domain-containing protein n=1 Tax=Candidatus Magasanikbacteria bacterium RIFOXYD2_FULL_41_14 TaxID=1798709 RepID=A0A1F6PFT8_9BACT|nr:MAG: hypothetical protein A2538_05050 [Candidatus Magasanikbacteria bacterium RIFOXYD2_FULL_41_14]